MSLNPKSKIKHLEGKGIDYLAPRPRDKSKRFVGWLLLVVGCLNLLAALIVFCLLAVTYSILDQKLEFQHVTGIFDFFSRFRTEPLAYSLAVIFPLFLLMGTGLVFWGYKCLRKPRLGLNREN